MAQTKYIKSSKDPHEELLSKTQELGFPDEQVEKALGDDPIFAIEYYNRHPIKIAYDGSKIHIRKVYEDDVIDKKQMFETFKKSYIRGFSKIIQEFSSLPFVIFGEYVPEKPNDAFIIFDMYVNDNWISHKDLINIVADNGFRYPRVLFHGLFDEEVIRKVMTSIDSDVNTGEKVKYAFVKSEMEAYYGSRSNRLGTIVSDFIPKKDNKDLKKFKERAFAIMTAYLSALIDASILAEWKTVVEKEGIEVKQENKASILSFVVEHSLNEMQVDIHQLSEHHNLEVDLIEGAIKKILPRYVMKAFKL